MTEIATDWQDRATTFEDALKLIGRGDRVFVGTGCATPATLLRELESLMRPPPGVQLIHFLLEGDLPEGYRQGQTNFRH
jgi:acyl-CoA hydrolase